MRDQGGDNKTQRVSCYYPTSKPVSMVLIVCSQTVINSITSCVVPSSSEVGAAVDLEYRYRSWQEDNMKIKTCMKSFFEISPCFKTFNQNWNTFQFLWVSTLALWVNTSVSWYIIIHYRIGSIQRCHSVIIQYQGGSILFGRVWCHHADSIYRHSTFSR